METHDYLFGGNMPLYSSALDTYALRQRTIAQNIANATTPGYRPQKVRFEEEFQEQQSTVSGLHSGGNYISIGPQGGKGVQPQREDAPIPKAEIYFAGQSSVNVDHEMSELAQNQIRYRLASRITQKYFQGLQSAIKGTTT